MTNTHYRAMRRSTHDDYYKTPPLCIHAHILCSSHAAAASRHMKFLWRSHLSLMLAFECSAVPLAWNLLLLFLLANPAHHYAYAPSCMKTSLILLPSSLRIWEKCSWFVFQYYPMHYALDYEHIEQTLFHPHGVSLCNAMKPVRHTAPCNKLV